MPTDVVEIHDPIAELAAIEAELARRRKVDELQHAIPSVFSPLFSPARYKGAYGGRGSAKSWTFAAMVLLAGINARGLRVVCIREVQRSLGQSVKRLLEDLIQKFALSSQFKVMATHIVMPGNGIIIFQGMQDHTADSIKSLEGFDIAWVEEAQVLSQRSLDLLRPTLRKKNSEMWFSWNPRFPTDPIDNFLRNTIKPPNAIVLQTNYWDNPYLPQVLRDELEWDQQRDPEKYAHIWLGEYEHHSESRVFKNWKVEEFDTVSDAMFLFGGDWGYAVDPTVLVRGFIIGRKLFVDREVYKVGCEIDHTPALFDSLDGGMARRWTIVTDSARPDTISYMQRHGYPKVTGAKKGPRSVEEGIEFLKTYDIVVHPRCQHVIDELRLYSFKTHPLTGEILPILQDKENHTIDSLRYMVESVRNPAENWVTW